MSLKPGAPFLMVVLLCQCFASGARAQECIDDIRWARSCSSDEVDFYTDAKPLSEKQVSELRDLWKGFTELKGGVPIHLLERNISHSKLDDLNSAFEKCIRKDWGVPRLGAIKRLGSSLTDPMLEPMVTNHPDSNEAQDLWRKRKDEIGFLTEERESMRKQLIALVSADAVGRLDEKIKNDEEQ